jgi:hypothetical protein
MSPEVGVQARASVPVLHPREMQDCTFNFSGKARRFRSLASEKAPMQLQVFRGEEDKKNRDRRTGPEKDLQKLAL